MSLNFISDCITSSAIGFQQSLLKKAANDFSKSNSVIQPLTYRQKVKHFQMIFLPTSFCTFDQQPLTIGRQIHAQNLCHFHSKPRKLELFRTDADQILSRLFSYSALTYLQALKLQQITITTHSLTELLLLKDIGFLPSKASYGRITSYLNQIQTQNRHIEENLLNKQSQDPAFPCDFWSIAQNVHLLSTASNFQPPSDFPDTIILTLNSKDKFQKAQLNSFYKQQKFLFENTYLTSQF